MGIKTALVDAAHPISFHVCSSAFLIVMSQLVAQRLLSEGIVFIIIGGVGTNVVDHT